MKLKKPLKLHFYGWLLSMPFITLALSYILYDDKLFQDWRYAAVAYPIIYVFGYVSWFMHSQYDHFLRDRFPTLEQTRQRVLYKVAVYLLVMTPSVLLIFLFFHGFHILGYSIQEHDLKYGLLVGLIVNVIFETLWELIYIIDKYKENVEEEEQLKQMQLEQEFENLKQKVNPHFLFNCFNTLLSLISEDKYQAEEFLNELSKVYRYLLKSNEHGLSTLGQELNFIESYASLLRTRFGNAFQVYIDINEEDKTCLLPSLTLQLLVENAAKHNIISKAQPIYVTIRTTNDGKLIVANTLSRKNHSVMSTGVGLANIRDKYKLLNKADIIVKETSDQYFVILPLIQEETLTV